MVQVMTRYVDQLWGGAQPLRMTILADFFKVRCVLRIEREKKTRS